MSLGQLRSCLILGRSSRSLLRQSQRFSPAALEGQRRDLTTDPSVYKFAPFPYEKRNFNYFTMMMDWTSSRMNENSVIIVVEGPPSSGKTELAQNVAKEFNLTYLAAPTETDLFTHNGFDIRQMNELLTNPKMRAYDMEMMFMEEDPSQGRLIFNTQMKFFEWKFRAYIKALRHILSTGQGVVVENSIWADAVYAEALYKLGYMSRNGIKYYKEFRKNAMYELWKPQLVLHIEGTTQHILDQMRSKYPQLANAPGLNEEFVDTVKNLFKKNYLPFMNPYSEVLSYDVTDLPDLELLTLDLEKMDLANAQIDNPQRFREWRHLKEELWSSYRYLIFNDTAVENMISQEVHNLPEEVLSGEESFQYQDIKNQIPELKYPTEALFYKDGMPRTDIYTRRLLKDSAFAPAYRKKQYLR